MKRINVFIIISLFCNSSLITAQEKDITYDICVYGESASGVVSSIQAARMGKKTLLISKNNHVGGLVTSGLTATDMNKNGVVGGITEEFYRNIYDYYLHPHAWKNQDRETYMESTKRRTYSGKNDLRKMQWVYESSVGEKIMLDMLKSAGVEVLFNSRLDLTKNVQKDGNRIQTIYLETGRSIKARIFIDASYEGDLMAKAGVSYATGRESNLQYGETLNGIRVNYEQGKDLSAIDPYIKKGKPTSGTLPYIDKILWGKQGEEDNRAQAYCYRVTLTNDPKNKIEITKPRNYKVELYELLARQLEIEPDTRLEQIITLTPMPNKKTDTNHLDFFGASYNYTKADYKERSNIEQSHKDYALGMLWFLGNDKRVPVQIRQQMKDWGLPKDEFKDSDNFPYQIYVREARRMVGKFVMTEKNIRKENRKPALHSIGLGSYALDCHYVSRVIVDGKLMNEGTIFAPTVPYPISYYSLTPKKEECDNLLVTVCVSASHVAYSTIRMEPVYMIMGQSAALAACIALDNLQPVQDISYDVLKYLLLKNNQIIDNI
ncbi:MAG: FAD-dependent oxidoreductase [Paludibacteraceae bacterium]